MVPLAARSRSVSAREDRPGPVVYWMSRDQRVRDFMLRGLAQTAGDLAAKGIGAGVLVTDFNPLRAGQERLHAVAAAVEIPVVEVDAHNVVPSWLASPEEALREVFGKVRKLR